MECKAWEIDGEGLHSPKQISVQVLHQTKVHMITIRGDEDGGDDLKSELPHLCEELTRRVHARQLLQVFHGNTLYEANIRGQCLVTVYGRGG